MFYLCHRVVVAVALLPALHLLAPIFFISSQSSQCKPSAYRSSEPCSLVSETSTVWLFFFQGCTSDFVLSLNILISFPLLFYGIYEVSYVCTEVNGAAKATNNYFTVTSFVAYFSDRSVHGVDFQVSKIIKSIKTCRGPRSGRQNTHRLLIF